MKELLQSGQGAIALGASHAENAMPQSAEGRNAGGQAGLSFLGSGSEAGRAALAKLEAAGMVERSLLEMGGGEPSEVEIKTLLEKYGKNWNTKSEAEKDKFLPAWEMTTKARLGSSSANKWCQDNNLTVELHGEVFRQLAARRRGEKMTQAEKAQGLTGEFLIFREVLPRLLNNRELVDQRTVSVPQQGGQNAAKP